jgi:acid phosphatase family membrane protein YuiD
MIQVTPLLIIPFLVWVMAQGIKFSLALVRGEFDLRYLFASGGMPSVHSAVVCSLATVAFIEGGATSAMFGIAAVYAGIVMYDSFGVRRSTGEQAHALNKLLDELTERGSIADRTRYGKLREVLGHKPTEVIAGALLGVVGAMAMEYNKVSPYLSFLAAQPYRYELAFYAIFSAVLVVSGAAAWIGQRKKRSARAKVIRRLGYLNLVIGVTLALLAGVQYEQISIASGRGLAWLVLVAWLAWSGVYIFNNSKVLRQGEIKDTTTERRDKWLTKAKRTKKKKK